MTRYEAWPVCAALIALAGAVLLRRGVAPREALGACLRLARYPAAAVVLFSANSRWTTGTWFVPPGFYVPDNEALGDAWTALSQVQLSVYALSGTAWVWPAYAAAGLLVASWIRSRRHASLILLLGLAAAAVLPAYAYYYGHPVRLRYGLPLVAGSAAITAGGIGLLPAPARPLAAVALIAWALVQAPPLDARAPLVTESRRDEAHKEGRRVVTAYLRQHWDGTPIMMSMGSLAHYMHDLTELDLHVRNFLHEGNENLWTSGVEMGPRGLVRWVAVEERAEGGDVLFERGREDPQFFATFERVAEGGGVALYRAQ